MSMTTSDWQIQLAYNGTATGVTHHMLANSIILESFSPPVGMTVSSQHPNFLDMSD